MYRRHVGAWSAIVAPGVARFHAATALKPCNCHTERGGMLAGPGMGRDSKVGGGGRDSGISADQFEPWCHRGDMRVRFENPCPLSGPNTSTMTTTIVVEPGSDDGQNRKRERERR